MHLKVRKIRLYRVRSVLIVSSKCNNCITGFHIRAKALLRALIIIYLTGYDIKFNINKL